MSKFENSAPASNKKAQLRNTAANNIKNLTLWNVDTTYLGVGLLFEVSIEVVDHDRDVNARTKNFSAENNF